MSLHGPTMDRALKLRVQLARLLNRRFSDGNEAKDGSAEHVADNAAAWAALPPPNASQEDTLRQVMTASNLDNIARRAPPGCVTQGNRVERQTAYLSCNETITEPLYIHPHSCLFDPDPKALPEFVSFSQIVRSGKSQVRWARVFRERAFHVRAFVSRACVLRARLSRAAYRATHRGR